MTGPYTAQIFLSPTGAPPATGVAPDMTLDWAGDELEAGNTAAWRYYRSGLGATLDGTLRAATLYVAQLLGPREGAYVQVLGREVGRSGNTPVFARDASARRDAAGRAFTTLGSRWSRERHFIGL